MGQVVCDILIGSELCPGVTCGPLCLGQEGKRGRTRVSKVSRMGEP